ncbi:acyl-CoA thioesterase domain-containing protein [Nocardioides sp.]|uniref:acyl-CoA thioesterase domain-containing protein n=1 Tax=Nocardioides sp. TaxID=35761 RepID=UPI002634E6A7|nr:acyl-CoA thioesterase domain-containing protein [Nocardioides sp.]
MNRIAYFTRTGETVTPLPIAASLWSADQMHGVAVSGLLALELERTLAGLGRSEMVPARYHVDLFRAARMVPTSVRATVLREGPRLVLIDAEVSQDGVVVARASATFLATGDQPTGVVWSAAERAVAPTEDEVPPPNGPRPPYWQSLKPWSQEFVEHQNAGRHATWQVPVPTVAGEEMTSFVAVAAISDTASMITNWGEAGMEWINTDISLAMSRRPIGLEIGIRALDQLSSAGVAVGVAELFDRSGTFGTATVTALANTRRTVNFEEHEHLNGGGGA